ncbi:MAG: outer membrane lipid asymmetry maintenance protein MlaD [Burkholderiales bacterium]
MERAKLDLLVGVFVAAGLAALLMLALKVGNMSSFLVGDSYTLNAQFDNIGGLKIRAPVKSAGVVVGRVVNIGFDNETFKADVFMRVENPYRFPTDTSASILTSGLIGEQYVGLDAGGDTEELQNDGQIALTQSAVVLENLIGQFLYNKAQEQPK